MLYDSKKMKKKIKFKKIQKNKTKNKKRKTKNKKFFILQFKKTKKETKNGKKIWKKNYFVKIIKALKLMYLPSPDELNFLKNIIFSVSFQVCNHVFEFISLNLNY